MILPINFNAIVWHVVVTTITNQLTLLIPLSSKVVLFPMTKYNQQGVSSYTKSLSDLQLVGHTHPPQWDGRV